MMLDIDNYRKYKRGKLNNRNPLQIAKYYLRNWGYFEKNILFLNDIEKEQATKLFKALKQLTEEERAFLASRYRLTSEQMRVISDKDIANKYEMTLLNYAELRKGVEYKLFHYLKGDLPFID